ncbi:MAG TPA: hypothetical protein VG963_30355 [Polyangiaceae bacterium]|nr:hypothetical protein [Polyangiaceae bacterium]
MLIVLVTAAYLPHGGRDRIIVRLRDEGGRVERKRTPYQSDPSSSARDLSSTESAQLRSDLEGRGIWRLTDHHREPIMDGLIAGFAFAQRERVHSVQLHCGAHDCELSQLLDFFAELAPISNQSSPGVPAVSPK